MTILYHPRHISQERVQFLIARGIDPRIAAIDLGMIRMNLMNPDEGPGWTDEQCDAAEVEYKRFLHLMLHRKHEVNPVPNKLMDTFWHSHILDTRAYHRDTIEIFGHYLHHFPYFGLRGDDDREIWRHEGELTARIYEDEFGESMHGNARGFTASSDCWEDCRSCGG